MILVEENTDRVLFARPYLHILVLFGMLAVAAIVAYGFRGEAERRALVSGAMLVLLTSLAVWTLVMSPRLLEINSKDQCIYVHYGIGCTFTIRKKPFEAVKEIVVEEVKGGKYGQRTHQQIWILLRSKVKMEAAYLTEAEESSLFAELLAKRLNAKVRIIRLRR